MNEECCKWEPTCLANVCVDNHVLSLSCLGRYQSVPWYQWSISASVILCAWPCLTQSAAAELYYFAFQKMKHLTSTVQETYTPRSARCARLARRFTDGTKATRNCPKRIAEVKICRPYKLIQEMQKTLRKLQTYEKM